MKFNPDPNKQAQKVYVSNRTKKYSSLFITFNNSKVETISSQKHLGLFLMNDLESKINKCFKIIGFLIRLPNKPPHDALLQIYKFFVRPNVDYGKIMYDKPNNESFTSKFETVQHKACLAITSPIQGTSRKHLVNTRKTPWNLTWKPSVKKDGSVSLFFSI